MRIYNFLGWNLIKSGHICKNVYMNRMPRAHGAGECANSVRKEGGRFFIFSQVLKGDGTGDCYLERTTSADCTDGKWQVDDKYDFYALTGKYLYFLFY